MQVSLSRISPPTLLSTNGESISTPASQKVNLCFQKEQWVFDQWIQLFVDHGILDETGSVTENAPKSIPNFTQIVQSVLDKLQPKFNATSILQPITAVYNTIKDSISCYPQIAGGAVPVLLGKEAFLATIKAIPGFEEIDPEQIQKFAGEFFQLLDRTPNDVDVQWILNGKEEVQKTLFSTIDPLQPFLPSGRWVKSPFSPQDVPIASLAFGSFSGAPLEFIFLNRASVSANGSRIRNYLFTRDSLKLQLEITPNPLTPSGFKVNLSYRIESLDQHDSVTEFSAMLHQFLMLLSTNSFLNLDLRAAGQFIVLQSKGYKTLDPSLARAIATILEDPSSGLKGRVENVVWVLEWGTKEHAKGDRYLKLTYVLNMLDFLLSNSDFSESELRAVWDGAQEKILPDLVKERLPDFYSPLIDLLNNPDIPLKVAFAWLKECALRVSGEWSVEAKIGNYLSRNNLGCSFLLKRCYDIRNCFLWLNLEGIDPLKIIFDFLEQKRFDPLILSKFNALEGSLTLKPRGIGSKSSLSDPAQAKIYQERAWGWISSTDEVFVEQGLSLLLQLLKNGKYSGDIGISFLEQIPSIIHKWQSGLEKEQVLKFVPMLDEIWNFRNSSKGKMNLSAVFRSIDTAPFMVHWISLLLSFKGPAEFKFALRVLRNLPIELRKANGKTILAKFSGSTERRDLLFQNLSIDLPFEVLVNELKKHCLKDKKLTPSAIVRFPVLKGFNSSLFFKCLPSLHPSKGSVEKQLFGSRLNDQKKSSNAIKDTIYLAIELNIQDPEIWKDIIVKVMDPNSSLENKQLLVDTFLKDEDLGRAKFVSANDWRGCWIWFIQSEVVLPYDLLNIKLYADAFIANDDAHPLSKHVLLCQTIKVVLLLLRRALLNPSLKPIDKLKTVCNELNRFAPSLQSAGFSTDLDEEFPLLSFEFIQVMLKRQLSDQPDISFLDFRDQILDSLEILFTLYNSLNIDNPLDKLIKIFLDPRLDIETSVNLRVLTVFLFRGLFEINENPDLFDQNRKNLYADFLVRIYSRMVKVMKQVGNKINEHLDQEHLILIEKIWSTAWPFEMAKIKDLFMTHVYSYLFSQKDPEVLRIVPQYIPVPIIQFVFTHRVSDCIARSRWNDLLVAVNIFDTYYRFSVYIYGAPESQLDTMYAFWNGRTQVVGKGLGIDRLVAEFQEDEDGDVVSDIEYDFARIKLFMTAEADNQELLFTIIADHYIPFIAYLGYFGQNKQDPGQRFPGLFDMDSVAYHFRLMCATLNFPTTIALPVVPIKKIQEFTLMHINSEVFNAFCLQKVSAYHLFSTDHAKELKFRFMCGDFSNLTLETIKGVIEDFLDLDTMPGIMGAVKVLYEYFLSNGRFYLFANSESFDVCIEFLRRILNWLKQKQCNQEMIETCKYLQEFFKQSIVNITRLPVNDSYFVEFEELAHLFLKVYADQIKSTYMSRPSQAAEIIKMIEAYYALLHWFFFKAVIGFSSGSDTPKVYDKVFWIDRYIRPLFNEMLLPLLIRSKDHYSTVISGIHTVLEVSCEKVPKHPSWWLESRTNLMNEFYNEILKHLTVELAIIAYTEWVANFRHERLSRFLYTPVIPGQLKGKGAIRMGNIPLTYSRQIDGVPIYKMGQK